MAELTTPTALPASAPVDPSVRRRHPGARWATLAPWCLWALGIVVTFRPALRSGFRLLQIGPGDPRLINYLLEHSWRFVLREPGHTSLWDPPFFYPVEGVGAYTDTMLGAIAPFGLLRALGLEPGPAFQLWMMTALSLAFLATYLLLARGLGLGRWPAAAGAFLTGFGSSRGASFNSPQLFTLFWGLFALYALARALEAANDGGWPMGVRGGGGSRRAPGWIAAAAALLALQAWSAFYPAFFFALVLMVAVVVAMVLPVCRERLLRLVTRHPAALALSAIGLGAALVPLARAHLAAVDVVGWQSWQSVAAGLPPMSTWFYPGRSNLLYQKIGIAQLMMPPHEPGQFSHGLGFVTTTVSLAGLVAARRRPIAALVLASTAIVIVLATVWPGGGSLWRVVWEAVPGARAIRYPARIGMLLTVSGSIGLALFLDRARQPWHRAAAIGAAALCLIEQPHHARGHHQDGYRAGVDRIAAEIDTNCEAFYLAGGLTSSGPGERRRDSPDPKRTQVAAMWVSLASGVPTVNGIAAVEPPGWAAFADAELDAGDGETRIVRELDRWARDHEVAGRLCLLTVAQDRMPWRDATKMSALLAKRYADRIANVMASRALTHCLSQRLRRGRGAQRSGDSVRCWRRSRPPPAAIVSPTTTRGGPWCPPASCRTTRRQSSSDGCTASSIPKRAPRATCRARSWERSFPPPSRAGAVIWRAPSPPISRARTASSSTAG